MSRLLVALSWVVSLYSKALSERLALVVNR